LDEVAKEEAFKQQEKAEVKLLEDAAKEMADKEAVEKVKLAAEEKPEAVGQAAAVVDLQKKKQEELEAEKQN
jgi:hypothetical protein